MKKLLLISFLIFLFAACKDDKITPAVEFDPNLIAGKWYLKINKDSIYYHFENGRAEREIWQADTLNKIRSKNLGTYRLFEEKIVYKGTDPDLYRWRNGELWMYEMDTIKPGFYQYTRID